MNYFERRRDNPVEFDTLEGQNDASHLAHQLSKSLGQLGIEHDVCRHLRKDANEFDLDRILVLSMWGGGPCANTMTQTPIPDGTVEELFGIVSMRKVLRRGGLEVLATCSWRVDKISSPDFESIPKHPPCTTV